MTHRMHVDQLKASTMHQHFHYLHQHPPPTPPPVNRGKEASEGASVRAKEIDPPPREQDARADAANGETRPPPIPPYVQSPETASGGMEGVIIRPESTTEVKSTAIMSASSSAASKNGARMAASPKFTMLMKLEAETRLQINQWSITRRKKVTDAQAIEAQS